LDLDAAEPTHKAILDICISFERTILTAEKFLKDLKEIWKTSSFNRYGGTWCLQAYRFVKINKTLLAFII
jgi:hypothetical protein